MSTLAAMVMLIVSSEDKGEGTAVAKLSGFLFAGASRVARINTLFVHS